MTNFISAIYTGAVTHTRLRPRRHHFRYSLYTILFDLDELPHLARSLRLFSLNRFNLFSFHERDFGDGGPLSLRQQIGRDVAAAGLCADGPVRLLAMPRVLGHVFNPISIFLCYAAQGRLSAILYEVHNTFGERHRYIVAADAADAPIARQECDKMFHVSPFMDMGMKYRFRVKLPAADLRIAITGSDAGGPLISAVQQGLRTPLSDTTLLRMFFAYPLVTFKVVAGIHFEALKLWLKGIKIRSKPPLPEQFVTQGRSSVRR